MTAHFLNITKTFLKALDDLSLGITVYPENVDFDPPSSGRWAELTIIRHDADPLSKDDANEIEGICQVSLYDADTGTTPAALLTLADTIANEFQHGTSYEHFTDVVVKIRSVTRSPGRMVGRYYQTDLSVNWTCYT